MWLLHKVVSNTSSRSLQITTLQLIPVVADTINSCQKQFTHSQIFRYRPQINKRAGKSDPPKVCIRYGVWVSWNALCGSSLLPNTPGKKHHAKNRGAGLASCPKLSPTYKERNQPGKKLPVANIRLANSWHCRCPRNSFPSLAKLKLDTNPRQRTYTLFIYP